MTLLVFVHPSCKLCVAPLEDAPHLISSCSSLNQCASHCYLMLVRILNHTYLIMARTPLSLQLLFLWWTGFSICPPKRFVLTSKFSSGLQLIFILAFRQLSQRGSKIEKEEDFHVALWKTYYVCVCNGLREMLDVNVKVEEPTQYKYLKNEYKRRVFLNNASFPRNGNVSIIYSYYRAAICSPFLQGPMINKPHVICHVALSFLVLFCWWQGSGQVVL